METNLDNASYLRDYFKYLDMPFDRESLESVHVDFLGYLESKKLEGVYGIYNGASNVILEIYGSEIQNTLLIYRLSCRLKEFICDVLQWLYTYAGSQHLWLAVMRQITQGLDESTKQWLLRYNPCKPY